MNATLQIVTPAGGNPDDLQAVLQCPCGTTTSPRWHTRPGDRVWGDRRLAEWMVTTGTLEKHRVTYPACDCIRALWNQHSPERPWDTELRELWAEIGELEHTLSGLEYLLEGGSDSIPAELRISEAVASTLFDIIDDGTRELYDQGQISEESLIRRALMHVRRITSDAWKLMDALSDGQRPQPSELHVIRYWRDNLSGTALWNLGDKAMWESLERETSG